MIFNLEENKDGTKTIIDSKSIKHGKVEHKQNLSARRNDRSIIEKGSYVGGTSVVRDNSFVGHSSFIVDTMISSSDIRNVHIERKIDAGTRKRVFQNSVVENSRFEKGFFVFDSKMDLCNCFENTTIKQSNIRKTEFLGTFEIQNSDIDPEDIFGTLVVDNGDEEEKVTIADAKIKNSRDIYSPERGVFIYRTNSEKFAFAASNHPDTNKIACGNIFISGFDGINALIPEELFQKVPECLRKHLHETEILARNLISFLSKEGIREISFDFAHALQCYGLKKAIISGFDFGKIIKINIKTRSGTVIPGFFFDGYWLRDVVGVTFSKSDTNFKV